MTEHSNLDLVTITELHNRLANQIVSQIVEEPLAVGGTMSDVMFLCESVLVGVVLGCFEHGADSQMLEILFDRARERIVKMRH